MGGGPCARGGEAHSNFDSHVGPLESHPGEGIHLGVKAFVLSGEQKPHSAVRGRNVNQAATYLPEENKGASEENMP